MLVLVLVVVLYTLCEVLMLELVLVVVLYTLCEALMIELVLVVVLYTLCEVLMIELVLVVVDVAGLTVLHAVVFPQVLADACQSPHLRC